VRRVWPSSQRHARMWGNPGRRALTALDPPLAHLLIAPNKLLADAPAGSSASGTRFLSVRAPRYLNSPPGQLEAEPFVTRARLVLHMDINKTILVSDKAQAADSNHIINMLLSECAWGRLERGPTWAPVGRLATDRCGLPTGMGDLVWFFFGGGGAKGSACTTGKKLHAGLCSARGSVAAALPCGGAALSRVAAPRPCNDPQLMTYRVYLESFLLPPDFGCGDNDARNADLKNLRQTLKRRSAWGEWPAFQSVCLVASDIGKRTFRCDWTSSIVLALCHGLACTPFAASDLGHMLQRIKVPGCSVG
jgi:hypothetical protein